MNVPSMTGKFKFPLAIVLILTVFICFGIFLRINDLGYSNFQGDEADTLDYLSYNGSRIDFLFDQKKGPMQYLINMMNTGLFGYNSEFQIRLPYALFGILAILFFGFLSSKIFNKDTGLIVAVLIAVNGLFISFSRIVQYQSFMYFLMPIAGILFVKALQTKRAFYFIISGIVYGMMLLTHYDAITMTPFFVVAYLLHAIKEKDNESWRTLIKNNHIGIIVFPAMSGLFALVFYLPYFLHSFFGTSTQTYLESRLTGGGFMPRTKFTYDLLSLYMPQVYMAGLFLLSILGIFSSQINFILNKKLKILFIGSLLGIIFAVIFSFFPIKPRSSSILFLGFSSLVLFVLAISQKTKYKQVALIAWYLFAFFAYLFVVKDPRTHVYMAILPGLILSGYGICSTYMYALKKSKFVSVIFLSLLSIVFFYLVGLYYVMYLDKKPEYPWWDKYYLGQNIYHIEKSNRVDGVFGFNHNREWEKIGDLYKNGCLVGTFESNEKEPVSDFYVGFSQLYGNEWKPDNFKIKPSTLIVVEAPHSWTYESKRDFSNYVLLDTLKVNDLPVTYIFGYKDVYVDGKYLCN